jgi:hypothetical protein
MVHYRQGLSLGLESGDYLFGVHAEFDDFEGHLAANWLSLFGHVDNRHATLTDLFQQLVAAHDSSRLFTWTGVPESNGRTIWRGKKAAHFLVSTQQRLDLPADFSVIFAGFIQKSGSLLARIPFDRINEY